MKVMLEDSIPSEGDKKKTKQNVFTEKEQHITCELCLYSDSITTEYRAGVTVRN